MDCEAMNIIEKLNEEFDVIMEKNIQLEKENLELHKANHKIKLKNVFDDEGRMSCFGLGGCDYFGNGFLDWSGELDSAVEFGTLEKDVILKELYGWPEDEPWERSEYGYPVIEPDEVAQGHRDWNEDVRESIYESDTFEGGRYH